ncbi:MAG: TrmH family RNA methyltransferase [Acidobacteriota bacterium]
MVLLHPKSPGNVGAVARVCANAGLGGLDLVGPLAWQDEAAYLDEARRRARHAAPHLERMGRFHDLASAVAGASFVAGTSVRTAGPQRLASPGIATREILDRATAGAVSVVFGREDRGMSVDELHLCDLKIHIPSSDDYPAWNLSHAVAVVAGSIREAAVAAPEPHRPFPPSDLAPASHDTVERLFADLESLLSLVGYLDENNPQRMMTELRRILASRGLEERDARILLGVLHQIRWALRR